MLVRSMRLILVDVNAKRINKLDGNVNVELVNEQSVAV